MSMERLTGVPEDMRNKRLEEQVLEALADIKLQASHLERTERNINVDVLRVNLIKMVGIVLFAVAVTAGSVTAYQGVLSKLDKVEDALQGIRSDNAVSKEQTESRLAVLENKIEEKTKDRFFWRDAEELSYRLCNEIERATGKPVSCPLVKLEARDRKEKVPN